MDRHAERAGDGRGHDRVERVGGEPVRLMHRVCPECGRLADEDPPTRCPHRAAVIDGG